MCRAFKQRMSQWNDLSRDRLIKEYRKYPCLWSNKDEDIKNAEKRKECLALITAELNNYEQHKTFTQEEVRTQFKNLRDMYRRKRKKLQLQLETNVSADEPGWVYFQRLKFLDDSIEFALPSDSAYVPPPKKKSKMATSSRNADDASLPTPLEEHSNGSSADGAFPSPNAHQQQKAAADELLLLRQSPTASAIEKGRGGGTETVKQEMVVEEDELFDHELQQHSAENSRHGTEMAAAPVQRQQPTETEDDTKPVAAAEPSPPPRGAVAEIVAQKPLNPSALLCTDVATSSTSSSGTSAIVQRQQRKAEPDEEDAEEFTCFGRFVAMTMRKITARSPIDALEARKEISDVLYFYQKRSLSK